MTHGKLQPTNPNNLLFLITVSTVWWHTSQDRLAFGSIFPTPCGTRSWRSLFLDHDFILTSYASLRDILAKQREEHRLLQIAPSLLKEVVNAFENFNKIFDQLETSSHPTLQIVIPKYYLVVSNLSANENLESMAACFLRGKIVCGTNEKYWTSIMDMPKIACFLDQSFKPLTFIINQSRLLRLLEGETCSSDTDNKDQPAKRVCRSAQDNDGLFAALRAVPEDFSSVECGSKLAADSKIEFACYMKTTLLPKCDDLCLYWKHQTTEMPILSCPAKRMLVFQASSG